MQDLGLYSAISRLGNLSYRVKIMVVAFLGVHIPLLGIVGYYVLRTTSDMSVVWGTLGVGLVATLVGTGITLVVLNGLLAPMLLTSRQLQTYRDTRLIAPLPTQFLDEAGTLMANSTRTLQRLDETLTQLETIDAVTGLANRDKFLADHRTHVASGGNGSVIVVQVTNLARLVSTYDQASADKYVRTFAAKLVEKAVGASQVARIDDGSFAIFFHDSVAAESTLAANLVSALHKSIPVGKVDVMPDFRVGIALWPEDGEDAIELLDAAVAAAGMGSERNEVQFHSSRTRDEQRDRFALEQDMRRAIKQNEFQLHYQPVVDLGAGRATGAEALIRWQHPERGLVAPGLFIPAAEQSGLIDQIGVWVIREACAQAGRWHTMGIKDFKIAVNLSARQFLDPRLTDILSEALNEARITAEKIEIELTESAAMADADYTRKAFGQLADLGISIAIDDFGTGYASMSYLRKLPFDKLKIDREFVSNIDTLVGSQAICKAMITLTQGLQLKVLAEGVERTEEVAYLAAQGCELFQGYYFSKPLAAQELPAKLARLSNTLPAVA